MGVYVDPSVFVRARRSWTKSSRAGQRRLSRWKTIVSSWRRRSTRGMTRSCNSWSQHNNSKWLIHNFTQSPRPTHSYPKHFPTDLLIVFHFNHLAFICSDIQHTNIPFHYDCRPVISPSGTTWCCRRPQRRDVLSQRTSRLFSPLRPINWQLQR